MVRGVRYAWIALGALCVGLGVLGAVLPVLPTTPFLLVALWAFSKSSRRLETWLLTHPRLGPRLVAWRRDRSIPLPVKLTAWGSMIASLTLMIATGRRPIWIAAAAALMAIGAIYVARCPTTRRTSMPAPAGSRQDEDGPAAAGPGRGQDPGREPGAVEDVAQEPRG